MNVKAISLAAIIGFSAPVITALTLHPPVVAQASAPLGTFQDNEWSVTIEYYNNALSYYGQNLYTGDSLSLRGAEVSGNSQRRLYKWRNGNYLYQVAWQPNDPGVIRVQVFDGAGKTILNRLLYEVYD